MQKTDYSKIANSTMKDTAAPKREIETSATKSYWQVSLKIHTKLKTGSLDILVIGAFNAKDASLTAERYIKEKVDKMDEPIVKIVATRALKSNIKGIIVKD